MAYKLVRANLAGDEVTSNNPLTSSNGRSSVLLEVTAELGALIFAVGLMPVGGKGFDLNGNECRKMPDGGVRVDIKKKDPVGGFLRYYLLVPAYLQFDGDTTYQTDLTVQTFTTAANAT